MFKSIPLLLLCALISCGNKEASKESASVEMYTKSPNTPDFNADSAYHFVDKQVSFGPRVPNSAAHSACGEYLQEQLRRFGATIFTQEMQLTTFDNTVLQAKNIIGSYNPEEKKRILLFAHWDSRPFACRDADPANHNTPIDGADDGASGVGVLLEIARHLGQQTPAAGVDIIFFDAEDYGPPPGVRNSMPDPWCLGSQFWAKNPHVPNYTADFGILLDMVGAKGATFYKESTSVRHAAPIVEKVWRTARDLGYGRYFINANGGGILDDHEYVIRGRGIPCIDIINLDPDTEHSFGAYWHTLNDTMEVIDGKTLKAVGQTVMEIIYTY